jgi:7,8-dihydropterin-6-yl-methyl-4-(beta-D-ribofuranosyl)aminobenzene 5'-phosphate synthase
MTAPYQLTILFDNYPGLPGFKPLWGFAALVQTPDRTLLFDTGSNGRVLLEHMARLGIAPASIDLLFLSHPHWDHIGGFDSILELNPRLDLIVHEGFSKHLIRDLKTQCRTLHLIGPEPQRLAPGLYSTGMLASEPPEHALLIESPTLVAVISGCAHPGMDQIVAHVKLRMGKRVDWAIGGFHLMYADADGIARTIQALQALGVHTVVPTHCTGVAAIAAFGRAYGARCIAGGVGAEIVLGDR